MRKLLLFSLPFALGTLLCQYLLPGFWRIAAVLPVLAAGLAAGRFVRRRYRRAVRILTAGLTAGLLWFAVYSAVFLTPAELLAGEAGTVRIELLDYAVKTDTGARCTVRVLDQGLRGKAVYYGSGSLLRWEPGDRVRTEAKFYSAAAMAGEENAYYTAQGVFARLYGTKETLITGGRAGSLRYLPQRLARGLRDTASALYEPAAAGLITALLTGERDGLDTQSSGNLSEAGLTHITAVSGLHCGFLLWALGILVPRRPRLMAALGYPALLLYMLIAGCTPSVVRSCVMAGFTLLAPLLNREADLLTSLSGALLVILLANPFAAASVSLQLSFAAVAGLLLPAPKIYGGLVRLGPKKLPGTAGMLWRFFAATTAASLGVMAATAPLSAVYFGTVSLAAPLSNLLVLWMAPALFACALLATVLGGAFPALAWLSVGPEWLGRYLLWAAHLAARIPGHSVCFTRPAVWLWMAGTYALLVLCLLVKGRRWKWGAALVLSAICLLAVKAGPRMQIQDDRLTAVAVDVGQGAALLLPVDRFFGGLPAYRIPSPRQERLCRNGNSLPAPELAAGDRVRITYDGKIAESYPAQIFGKAAIERLEEE